MKSIESKQNPIFKKALKIIHDQSKFPDLIVVEGAKLIREALQAGLKPQTFFCSKKKDNSLKDLENLGFEIAPSLFRELTTVTSPDEGLCIFARPAFAALDKILISAKLLVIIDRLQDPGNIGTILRTCEAMGSDAVIILKGSCNHLNHKAIRAAMGSTFRLPTYDQMDFENLFELLKKFEFTAICADMSGQKLTEFRFPARTAIILGNEGQGVAEKIKKVCSMKLAIPMCGQVESLNVATSAAICLYEWAKQHQMLFKA